MSDDALSFFDDPVESPSPTPSPAPAGEQSGDAGAPAPAPTVTPEQFAELQQRLQSAEQWKQDLGRMLLGQNGQQNQQQVDPQAFLQQFLANPLDVMQNMQQGAVTQAQEAMRNQAIIDDRRAKHPELAKLEPLIDWNSAINTASQAFFQANGRTPSFAEALDTAIVQIKSGLQGVIPGAQQQQNGVTSQVVMNMDITGSAGGNSRPLDLSTVSDADWPKIREQYKRGFNS